MIKTILIAFLFLTLPAVVQPNEAEMEQICREIREILAEQVREGYINEQEAHDISQGCK